jgi:hypothetical protein
MFGVKKGLSPRLTNYVLLAQKKTLLKYTHVESRVEVLVNMESTNEKKSVNLTDGLSYRPPSFQLIFQILPEATLHQLLPESHF